VIWNSWDESVAWVERTQALVHEHVKGSPQQRTSRWAEELEQTGLFTPLQQETFPNIVRGDVETLLARISSVSYVAALEDAERMRLLDAVRAVVASDPETMDQTEFRMPYTTHVAWCRRR
jgi:hypothetical protein